MSWGETSFLRCGQPSWMRVSSRATQVRGFPTARALLSYCTPDTRHRRARTVRRSPTPEPRLSAQSGAGSRSRTCRFRTGAVASLKRSYALPIRRADLQRSPAVRRALERVGLRLSLASLSHVTVRQDGVRCGVTVASRHQETTEVCCESHHDHSTTIRRRCCGRSPHRHRDDQRFGERSTQPERLRQPHEQHLRQTPRMRQGRRCP